MFCHFCFRFLSFIFNDLLYKYIYIYILWGYSSTWKWLQTVGLVRDSVCRKKSGLDNLYALLSYIKKRNGNLHLLKIYDDSESNHENGNAHQAQELQYWKLIALIVHILFRFSAENSLIFFCPILVYIILCIVQFPFINFSSNSIALYSFIVINNLNTNGKTLVFQFTKDCFALFCWIFFFLFLHCFFFLIKDLLVCFFLSF